MSVLAVSIPALIVDAEKDYVSFRIIIRAGDEDEDSWSFQRRFQDFVKLHAVVSRAIKSGEVPELPPKGYRMGKAKFEPEFLQERRVKLEAYLQAVVEMLPPETCEALDDFLQYAQYGLRVILGRLSSSVKENSSDIESAFRLLKDAGESASGRGLKGGRKDSSEGESEEVSAFSPPSAGGGGSKDNNSEVAAGKVAPLVKEACRHLSNYKASVSSRAEDKELKEQALQSTKIILENKLKAKLEDGEEVQAALEALIATRMKECDRERGALAKCGVSLRTVAAELNRVEKECSLLENLQTSHKACAMKIRGGLGGWECGESISSSALTELSQECTRVEKESSAEVTQLASSLPSYASLMNSISALLSKGSEPMVYPVRSNQNLAGDLGIKAKGVQPSEQLLPPAPRLQTYSLSGPDQIISLLLQSSSLDTRSLAIMASKISCGKLKQAKAPPLISPSPLTSTTSPAQSVKGGKASATINAAQPQPGNPFETQPYHNEAPSVDCSRNNLVGISEQPRLQISKSNPFDTAGNSSNPFFAAATTLAPENAKTKSKVSGNPFGNPF